MFNDKTIVARHIKEVFGGEPTALKYYDDTKETYVSVLTSSDDELVSSSTVGLFNSPTTYTLCDKQLRVEIFGVAYKEQMVLPNIIATCNLDIVKNNIPWGKDEIILDVITHYLPSSDMKHVVLIEPFSYSDIGIAKLTEYNVGWLQILPISVKEYEYMKEVGLDSLKSILDNYKINIFDLNRPSVL